jgi:hypothetical protein
MAILAGDEYTPYFAGKQAGLIWDGVSISVEILSPSRADGALDRQGRLKVGLNGGKRVRVSGCRGEIELGLRPLCQETLDGLIANRLLQGFDVGRAWS